MPIFSNVDEVGAWLTDVVKSIDFTIPGVDSAMGLDTAFAVAEGIYDRSDSRQQGADARWPENSEPYKSDKLSKYGTDKTNFRTGQMISLASMLANVTIEPRLITMLYGTGLPPTSSVNGYIEEEDKLISDREKAAIAHEEGRPFFEVDETIDAENVMPILREALGKYLEERANA